MTPKISPSLIDRVKSSTAVIFFLSEVNILLNPSIDITVIPLTYLFRKSKTPFCKRTERRNHRPLRSLICQSNCFAGIGTFQIQDLKVAAGSQGQPLHRSG